MISIVAKTLKELNASGKTFQAIYQVIRNHFHDEIFGEILVQDKVIKTSYAELEELAERTAACITARFSEKRSSGIIGIYMENSVEWVAAFWGILMAGFRPLLLNTRQDLAITKSIVEEMKPECVITEQEALEGKISFTQLLSDTTAETGPEQGSCQWEDHIIMVTSGSTERPKIIVHNGKTICSQIELSADILKKNITMRHNRRLEVRMLAFLPFYHIFGLVAVLMWFSFFGRTFIFVPDLGVNTIRETCQKLKVTHFFAVPLVWEGITRKLLSRAQEQQKEDTFRKLIRRAISLQTAFPHFGPWIVRNLIFRNIRKEVLGTSLNFLISGGGFISDTALEVMNGLGYSLYPGYGLTECGIVSVNISRKARQRLTGGNGPVFSNIRCRINENQELEIERDHALTGRYVDGAYIPNNDPWFNTNDMVRIDENGELFLIGRTDDLIITENGENISPEMIETKLDTSALVSAVIVYTSYEGRKQLVLALELDEDNSIERRVQALQALFDSVNALPLSERPSVIVSIAGAIPRNVKGIDRKELARMLSEGSLLCEPLSAPEEGMAQRYDSEEYRAILQKIKDCFRQTIGITEEISDTASFVSLGGDSMMYVELLQSLSELFDVHLDFSEKPMITPLAFADYIYEQETKKPTGSPSGSV